MFGPWKKDLYVINVAGKPWTSPRRLTRADALEWRLDMIEANWFSTVWLYKWAGDRWVRV